MQLGDLDRRITIQTYSEVTDIYGQRIPVWSTHSTVWAKLAYESGEEKFEGDEKVAVRHTKFFVRYLSTITEKMRIIYDGSYYDIRSIEEVGRDRFMVLRCLKRDSTT